jgi:hypothetical protein
MSAMALAITAKQLQQAECDKLREGDDVYYWRHASSTWMKTSFIRVCQYCALASSESVAAQHVFTTVERQGCHDLAPAVAVSGSSAAVGAMHVDQDEEVEDETRLHEFQNTMCVPWIQGLSVTELDALSETTGTALACELENVLMSKCGNDEGRIRDELKHTKIHGLRHRNSLCQDYNSTQGFCDVQDSRHFFELY